MPTVNDIKLSDFAQMVRMSAEGKFKTSIEKTTGGIYVDSDGNVRNVRHTISNTKGDAAQNLLLRQKLVDAFVRGHATQQFLNVVRQKLGLKADNTAANASAGKALDRRDVKVLLAAFSKGSYPCGGNANVGQTMATHGFVANEKTKKIGNNEWVEVTDPKFDASVQRLANGLSRRIMNVFIEQPEKMFKFYEKMVEQSGVEGVNKDHPPTSEAEIRKFVEKVIVRNWHSNPALKAILTGTMKEDATAQINDAMHDHLYSIKGTKNKSAHKKSGLAWEFLRVGNGKILGESSIRDIITVNGHRYDHGNISPEQEEELEKAFEKPDTADKLGTPWERNGAYLPLAHALVTLLPPDIKGREKFLLFATNMMGYNGPSSIGANPEISGKDLGYGRLEDFSGKCPVLVVDNGGTPVRMDLSVVNGDNGKPKSLVLTQEYGVGPALSEFFGCRLTSSRDGHHIVEMGRFETTVTIDLTQGLDENGKPKKFTTSTRRLQDAPAPEVQNAPIREKVGTEHALFTICEYRLERKGYLSPVETDGNGKAFVTEVMGRMSEEEKRKCGLMGRNLLASVANRFGHRPDLLKGLAQFNFASLNLAKYLLQLDDEQVAFILDFAKPYGYSMSGDLLASLIEHRKEVEQLLMENPKRPIACERIVRTLLPDASDEHIAGAMKNKRDLAAIYEEARGALISDFWSVHEWPGSFMTPVECLLTGKCRTAEIEAMIENQTVDSEKMSKLTLYTTGANRPCSYDDGGDIAGFLDSLEKDVRRQEPQVIMTGDDGREEEMCNPSNNPHWAELACTKIFEKLMDRCHGRMVQAQALVTCLRQDNFALGPMAVMLSDSKDSKKAEDTTKGMTFTFGRPNEDGSIDVSWHFAVEGQRPPSGDIVRRVMPDGSVRVISADFTLKSK